MSLSPTTRRLFVASCATAAALVAACADVSAPTEAGLAPSHAAASKGGSGGGGGGGGGSSTPLIVTTRPTVNITGSWAGTSDGPDIVHNYTFTLQQKSDGTVSGSGTMSTPFQNSSYLVAGTVNGDTLTLYTGPGTVTAGGSLSPLYSGIVVSNATQVDGRFLNGGVSPVRLFKQ